MIISKEAAVMRSDRSFYELNKDFEKIYTVFSSLNSVEFAEINCNKTVHIAVDMVNGFVKFGALSSNEVMSINNDVADFAARCKENGIANYALCDCHPDNCAEFQTYPVHCVKDTPESELTDELKKAADFKIFPKLSVNGWLEDEFRNDIISNGFDTFIITGGCTDMCVIQLALSIKSGLNRINRNSRVIVVKELTATCSLPSRLPETAELAAFLIMQTNGIEVCQNVR